METTGTVRSIRMRKGRGRIEFDFQHNDETVKTGNAVYQTKIVKAIQKDQSVNVVYRRDKPKKAFIRDIFA